MANRKS